jgi:hypothetical protein
MTNTLMTTMAVDEVRQRVRERGTRFATVMFLKKDGSVRKINGLFRATSKLVGGDRGAAQHDVLRANDLVAIYSLKDRGWRSFKADSVLEVR